MKNIFYHWIPAFAGMTIALLFSFYLMFHTFSYDAKRHELLIASKAWSDFGAHIPLIRSFSYGPNLTRLFSAQPIESPLFPKEPIRYHFGFYAIVGLLEKLGVRIDWALNIPSALGFFLLLLCIFQLSYFLFKNYWISFLSILFTLFNGSLSFVKFFQTHGIADIITNSRFPSFGPWDGRNITAFWTLNIYTNQRHLALSYGLILLCLLVRKKPLYVALIASLLIFVHYAAFAILCLFLLWIFIVDHTSRRTLIISGICTIPAIYFLTRVANIGSGVVWHPGYLATKNILRFWFENLGLHMFLIPLGLLLAPNKIRRVFLVPLLILFVAPNLFRFSTDMINNHKFFNFFLIIGNMFSAYAIVFLAKRFHSVTGVLGYLFIGVLVVLTTLSGIIDFFPIVNDYRGTVSDKSEDRKFFMTLPQDAVIANSTWFYHPASLAGRSLFSGYTYFTWSYGYNQTDREQHLRAIYSAPNRQTLCDLIRRNNVAAIELNPKPETYLSPNLALWHTLPADYENPTTHLKIFSTKNICE